MHASSDQDIIRQVLAGNTEAFAQLVQRHAGMVHAMALRMTGNAQDAEDLAQDAFVRAFKHLGRYDCRRSFTTWLYTVALNVVRNHLKKSSREPRGHVLPPGSEADHLREEDAEQLLIRDQESARLQQGLLKLQLKHREVLVLRFFQDLSFRETAKVLRISPGAAKMRVYRALERLQAVLEKGKD